MDLLFLVLILLGTTFYFCLKGRTKLERLCDLEGLFWYLGFMLEVSFITKRLSQREYFIVQA